MVELTASWLAPPIPPIPSIEAIPAKFPLLPFDPDSGERAISTLYVLGRLIATINPIMNPIPIVFKIDFRLSCNF